MLTSGELAEWCVPDIYHLPGGVGIDRMGEQEACPSTDIVVGEELGGMECRLVQSCFAIGPRRDGHGNYQWDSLAFG
jgi:hypothetical protein